MSRVGHLRPDFVDSFPQPMSSGILYISVKFNSCGHLCCCGCGSEVITPLSPAQWSFAYNGQEATLEPSIGNWTLECKSHYWVRSGRVTWSRRFTGSEVEINQTKDRADLEALYATPSSVTFWDRFRRFLPWV